MRKLRRSLDFPLTIYQSAAFSYEQAKKDRNHADMANYSLAKYYVLFNHNNFGRGIAGQE